MGGVCATQASSQIENPIKLILLGCPAVGKSTVFKQLTLIYRDGFSNDFRRSLRQRVLVALANTVLEIYKIGKEELGEETTAEDAVLESLALTISEMEAKIHVEDTDTDSSHHNTSGGTDEKNHDINETLKLIHKLNQSPLIEKLKPKVLMDDRDKYCARFPPSAEYYLERLPEIIELISSPQDGGKVVEYLPSDSDILRLRRTTLEAASVGFNHNIAWPPGSSNHVNVPINCTDVGGQSQHEYDWVAHGKDCNAVLYVMCLSDFDEKTESGENKLKESLSLLKRLAASPVFKGKMFVILFNKSDLLAEKLKHKKVQTYFSSYMGENTEDEVIEYFEERCNAVIDQARSEAGEFEEISTSIVQTCAVNSKLMEQVLTRVLFGLFQATIRKVWN